MSEQEGMSLYITNIQRFSLHDGPGIRTTVFLKGCSAKCPWCANPEAMRFGDTFFYKERKCIKTNNTCIINRNCPILSSNKLSNISPDDVLKCRVKALENTRIKIDNNSLLESLLLDKAYYGNDGGVTFSGGEALLQTESLIPVLKKLKLYNINTAVETSLKVPTNCLKRIIKYIDFFYVDVKSLEKEVALSKIGIDVDLYINNFKYLLTKVSNEKIILRFPVAKGYTDSETNILLIRDFINKYKIKNVEIFSVHNLAEKKYTYLRERYTPFKKIDNETLKNIKSILESNGKVDVVINKV